MRSFRGVVVGVTSLSLLILVGCTGGGGKGDAKRIIILTNGNSPFWDAARAGEYVTFVGMTGAQNAKERVGGFADGAGSKFKALDNMGDETDRTKARDNVRNAIRNHDNLNVLVGIWSYNAPAIVDVVKEK